MQVIEPVKQKLSGMEKILVTITSVISTVVITWCLIFLWEWFVTPTFHVAAPTWFGMYGLYIMYALVTFNSNVIKMDDFYDQVCQFVDYHPDEARTVCVQHVFQMCFTIMMTVVGYFVHLQM